MNTQNDYLLLETSPMRTDDLPKPLPPQTTGTNTDFEVVQAGLDDVEAVFCLMDDCMRWLRGRGLPVGPPGCVTRKGLAAQAGAGILYIARRQGAVIGVLRLQWSDPETWGVMPDDAGYVHGFTVQRACAGQGIGRRMLAWAEQKTADAGKHYLRLDCNGDNAILRGYYEAAGFAYKGPSLFFDYRGIATVKLEKRVL